MDKWFTDLWDLIVNVHFTDWLVACVLALFSPVLVWLWKGLQHRVAHTSTHKHKVRAFSLPVFVCGLCLMGSWLMFSMAQGEPKSKHVTYSQKYQAREFLLTLDRSSSMFTWDIDAPDLAAFVDQWELDQFAAVEALRAKYPMLYPNPPEPPIKRPDGTDKNKIQRFQAALFTAEKFLKSRPDDDRFAMYTFDDEPYLVEPLGKDRKLLLDSIKEISRKSGGGTNFDGPRKGNPRMGIVQKAIDHFRLLGKAKVKVMIHISDGEAGITPERHQQLVDQMKQPGQEIHIYFLVCGPKSNMDSSNTESIRKLVKAVNPDDPKRPEFQQAVIWAGDGQSVTDAFALINRLETSLVESEPVTEDRDVRHEFIIAGCVLLALFIGLATALREDY